MAYLKKNLEDLAADLCMRVSRYSARKTQKLFATVVGTTKITPKNKKNGVKNPFYSELINTSSCSKDEQ
jgi:hypothetical protein